MFGGFLMRNALELSWIAGNLYRYDEWSGHISKVTGFWDVKLCSLLISWTRKYIRELQLTIV
jgi:hypothetical protein